MGSGKWKCVCIGTVALIVLSPSLVFSQTAANPPTPAPPRPPRVVPPARILSFKAQPETIQAGQPVTLVWATENPNGLTISPGIGRVTARGTRQVNPLATTTYILTANGPNNTSVTQSVTVTVNGAAPVTSSSQTSAKDPRMPDGKPDLTGVYGFAGRPRCNSAHP